MTATPRTPEEIAETTGIPVDTVSQAMDQIKKAQMAATLLVRAAAMNPNDAQQKVADMLRGAAMEGEANMLVVGFISLANSLAAERDDLKRQLREAKGD